MKNRRLMLILSLLNTIEYVWMWLNKQDSENVSGPKYVKILNTAKFWIWQGSQYASVRQRSKYIRICHERVLNICWVLNMPGFWILQSSAYSRVTQGFKCHNMAEYVWIEREYTWIFLNIRQQAGLWICIIHYLARVHSTC